MLCHGVIMYLDDPRPLIEALADLAEQDGIVSLVAKNAKALATQPALAGRWADALAAFDGDHQINGLGLNTRADTLENLIGLLATSGVRPLAWYGVRLFTDSWTPAALGADAEQHALQVEDQASRRGMSHLLARFSSCSCPIRMKSFQPSGYSSASRRMPSLRNPHAR